LEWFGGNFAFDDGSLEISVLFLIKLLQHNKEPTAASWVAH